MQVLKIASKPLTTKKNILDIPDNIMKPVLNRMAYEDSLLRVGAQSLRSNIINYVSTKEWAGKSFVQADSDKAPSTNLKN